MIIWFLIERTQLLSILIASVICIVQAIIGYRETEKQIWKEKDNSAIVERLGKEVISFYGNKSAEILPHVHILDLAADGYI